MKTTSLTLASVDQWKYGVSEFGTVFLLLHGYYSRLLKTAHRRYFARMWKDAGNTTPLDAEHLSLKIEERQIFVQLVPLWVGAAANVP